MLVFGEAAVSHCLAKALVVMPILAMSPKGIGIGTIPGDQDHRPQIMRVFWAPKTTPNKEALYTYAHNIILPQTTTGFRDQCKSYFVICYCAFTNPMLAVLQYYLLKKTKKLIP